MESNSLVVILKKWEDLNIKTFTIENQHYELEEHPDWRYTCSVDQFPQTINNLDLIIEKALLSAGILKPNTEVRAELFRSWRIEVDLICAGIEKSQERDNFYSQIWK